jgi:hypothetical protein
MEDAAKKMTEALLDEILKEEDLTEEIKSNEIYLLTAVKPTKLVGKDSAEILAFRNFEQSCYVLRQKNYSNPEKLSVFKFLEAVNLVKQTSKNG